MKFVFEQVVTLHCVDVEDGGRAKIAHIDGEDGKPEGMFVRIHSWSDSKEHADLDALTGRRVRVTIETIEDAHD